MGFMDAKTILATGNVIVAAKGGDAKALKAQIQSALGNAFSYEAHVILRSQNEIAEICSAAQAIAVPEGCHLYFLLCDDEETLLVLKQLFDSMPHISEEQFLPFAHGAFWIVPKGATLDSEFGSKILGGRKYKSLLTSRNIHTIEKIYKSMLE